MKATCEIKRCRRHSLLGYGAFGPRRTKEVGVCEYHWEKHCDEEDKFDLRSYFYPPAAGQVRHRGVENAP
jgi:hypothetical protein